MARFFIDTSDERHFIRDEVGFDYDDVDGARTAAVDALPDMARDQLPDGDHRTFLALVRDDRGRTLMQASLTLNVIWLTQEEDRGG